MDCVRPAVGARVPSLRQPGLRFIRGSVDADQPPLREHAEEIRGLIRGNESIEGSRRRSDRSHDLPPAPRRSVGGARGIASGWTASNEEERREQPGRHAYSDVSRGLREPATATTRLVCGGRSSQRWPPRPTCWPLKMSCKFQNIRYAVSATPLISNIRGPINRLRVFPEGLIKE